MTRIAARLTAQRARRALDERGVTMVIFGLVIVALLIIVAVVLDLGNARQECGKERSAHVRIRSNFNIGRS